MSSRSINKVILIGNLTRDPELKYTPNGTAVSTFGVATNRNWTTQTGETKEDVQFHRIVAWQKLAELSSKLLVKGRKVYVEGRLVYRTYTGKDGLQKSITEIILDDFVVFDARRISETPDTGAPDKAPPSPNEEHPTKSDQEPAEKITTNSEHINPDDIDIPF